MSIDVDPESVASLERAMRATVACAKGDSNDEEIEALQDALAVAVGIIVDAGQPIQDQEPDYSAWENASPKSRRHWVRTGEFLPEDEEDAS